MEFGECPNCDKPTVNYLPDEVSLPILEKVMCESCEKPYFIKHSRVDPEAYTIQDAEELYPDMKPVKKEKKTT